MICISKTADAYHSGYCNGMMACTHRIEKATIKEAVTMGNDPSGFVTENLLTECRLKHM